MKFSKLVLKIRDNGHLRDTLIEVAFYGGGKRLPEEPNLLSLTDRDLHYDSFGIYAYTLEESIDATLIDGAYLRIESRRKGGTDVAPYGVRLWYLEYLELYGEDSLVCRFEAGQWAQLGDNNYAEIVLVDPQIGFTKVVDVSTKCSPFVSRPDVQLPQILSSPSNPPYWNPLDIDIPFATYSRYLNFYGWNYNRWYSQLQDINLNGIGLKVLDPDEPIDTVSGGPTIIYEFSFSVVHNFFHTDPGAYNDVAFAFTYDLRISPTVHSLHFVGRGTTSVTRAGPAFRYMAMHVSNLTRSSQLFFNSFNAEANDEHQIPSEWTNQSLSVEPGDEIRISFLFWIGSRSGESTRVICDVGMATHG